MSGGPGRAAGVEAPVLDAENPWPGLAPFAEDQAVFFHGRRKEVEELFRLVRLNPLTVLYGQSGLGKTSLLSAALFPRLRSAGYLPVPIRLHYSAAAPGPRAQLWLALVAAFESGGVKAPPLGDDETLWEYFHRRSLALPDRNGNPIKPVLIFDQFEELFTLGAERADGGAFVQDGVSELAALIENHPPDRVEARFNREPTLVAQFDFDRQDHRVLLSLREDYLAHLHDLAPRIPSITLNNLRLTPLDGPRALDAVEKPGGALVTPDVAEAIVRFVAGSAEEHKSGDGAGGAEPRGPARTRPIEALVVDPSLLSLSCRELNQKRRAAGERRITPALVAESSENILSEFYERSLSDLPAAVRVFVEDELLTPSGFRETKALESARSELAAAGVPAEVLNTLVARRLLHYELRGRDTRVELTHDVLTKVVSASRDRRRAVEAEREEKLRLQEAESRARAAQEEARAELLETQARQRKLRVLAGALGLVAVLAAVQSWRAGEAKGAAVANALRADSAAKMNKSVSDTLRRKSDSLARVLAHDSTQQVALRDTTLRAQEARHLADSLRQASQVMADTFCISQLNTINSLDLGDVGLGTIAKPERAAEYVTALEVSDASVERMIARSPEADCPRRLEARVESVLPGLLMQRGQEGDTARARERGKKGIEAAKRLAGSCDTLSRQVAAQSLYTLTYFLWFAEDASASFDAGRAALPLIAAVDPSRDSLANDHLARIYHYGALSLMSLKRPREAVAWVDTGLAVVRRGRARPDQNQRFLAYTESQLQLGLITADTTLHDSTGALAAGRAAIEAARQLHVRSNLVYTAEWLAKMHATYGGLARALGRPGDATVAYDSSGTQWGSILKRGRVLADNAIIVDALTGLINALTSLADTRIDLHRRDQALILTRAAVDSARVLVQVSPTADSRRELSSALTHLAIDLEFGDSLAAAEAVYRSAVQVDSTVIALNLGDRGTAERTLVRHYNNLNGLFRKREIADTAGRDSAAAVRALRAGAEIHRLDLASYVWFRRRTDSLLHTTASREALADELSNLSYWSLLTDRPEEAVLLAQEGQSLTRNRASFVLPNLFNALLLSGRDEDAERLFQAHARDSVESTPVLFPCAAVRDTRELRRRGVALDRHVQFVERLLIPYAASCQKPKSPGTP